MTMNFEQKTMIVAALKAFENPSLCYEDNGKMFAVVGDEDNYQQIVRDGNTGKFAIAFRSTDPNVENWSFGNDQYLSEIVGDETGKQMLWVAEKIEAPN